MRATHFTCAAAVLVGLLVAARTAHAQATPQLDAAPAQILRQEIEQLRREFEARLAGLESRLAAVEGRPAGAAPARPTADVPAGAQGAGGPSGSLPVYGGAAAASKIFNPDMAVIGDFLGAAGRNRIRADPAFQMHESEVSLQAIVDPYARADFFVSFGEEGVNIEEGFVTFPTLPGGILMKAGKMRAAFGKVNALHNHVLPWADRPLVNVNLLNGEDGLNDAGISIARLIPNPWFFLEATGQAFRGDSGALFQSTKRGDLSYVGHLRGYQDITESTNIDLGASYSRGHTATGVLQAAGDGSYITNLVGIDATLRWRPLQRSIYHSFVGRSEVIWSRRDQPGGLQRGSGFYASGDYQFARRWFVGARLDRSDHADAVLLRDRSESVVVTYWPSEFSQARGQYRVTRYGEGATAHELLFQLQFSIGAHGAHPF